MPYSNTGKLFCPCCGTRFEFTCTDSGLIAADITGVLVNRFEEETSPQGDLRQDSLPEGTDA